MIRVPFSELSNGGEGTDSTMLPSDLHMCVMTCVLCNYTQNKNKSAKNLQKIQVGWTHFFYFVLKVPREKDVGIEMGRR